MENNEMNVRTHKKKNIVLLGPLPPTIGGVATYIQNLLASPLHDEYRFITVRTMSRKHGSPDYEKEMAGVKAFRVLWDLAVLVTVLIARKPVLVHINTSFNSGPFWRDALYCAASRVFGKKVFFQVHGGRLDCFLDGIPERMRSLALRILRMPSCIGVLSQAQLRPFYAHGIGHRAVLIPNMIDTALFQKYPGRRNIHREKDGPMALFVASHMSTGKGVMDLLQAIPEVVKIKKDVRFVLVGDGGKMPEMLETCKSLGIGPHVHFPGFLTHGKLIPLMQDADIFVLPSHSEGFPFVVLEAMAAGLPVVATPVGAVPEILHEGRNGFLFPAGNAPLMAECILRLLSDPALCRTIGKTNREDARKYDIPSVACLIADLYEHILLSQERRATQNRLTSGLPSHASRRTS